ncbi:MAG TPA: hypothetical protein PLQ67_03430 [Burkholderiaceae bacterium]|nr:hypothetical protein [Burkholderiaceae bacterium]
MGLLNSQMRQVAAISAEPAIDRLVWQTDHTQVQGGARALGARPNHPAADRNAETGPLAYDKAKAASDGGRVPKDRIGQAPLPLKPVPSAVASSTQWLGRARHLLSASKHMTEAALWNVGESALGRINPAIHEFAQGAAQFHEAQARHHQALARGRHGAVLELDQIGGIGDVPNYVTGQLLQGAVPIGVSALALRTGGWPALLASLQTLNTGYNLSLQRLVTGSADFRAAFEAALPMTAMQGVFGKLLPWMGPKHWPVAGGLLGWGTVQAQQSSVVSQSVMDGAMPSPWMGAANGALLTSVLGPLAWMPQWALAGQGAVRQPKLQWHASGMSAAHRWLPTDKPAFNMQRNEHGVWVYPPQASGMGGPMTATSGATQAVVSTRRSDVLAVGALPRQMAQTDHAVVLRPVVYQANGWSRAVGFFPRHRDADGMDDWFAPEPRPPRELKVQRPAQDKAPTLAGAWAQRSGSVDPQWAPAANLLFMLERLDISVISQFTQPEAAYLLGKLSSALNRATRGKVVSAHPIRLSADSNLDQVSARVSQTLKLRGRIEQPLEFLAQRHLAVPQKLEAWVLVGHSAFDVLERWRVALDAHLGGSPDLRTAQQAGLIEQPKPVLESKPLVMAPASRERTALDDVSDRVVSSAGRTLAISGTRRAVAATPDKVGSALLKADPVSLRGLYTYLRHLERSEGGAPGVYRPQYAQAYLEAKRFVQNKGVVWSEVDRWVARVSLDGQLPSRVIHDLLVDREQWILARADYLPHLGPVSLSRMQDTQLVALSLASQMRSMRDVAMHLDVAESDLRGRRFLGGVAEHIGVSYGPNDLASYLKRIEGLREDVDRAMAQRWADRRIEAADFGRLTAREIEIVRRLVIEHHSPAKVRIALGLSEKAYVDQLRPIRRLLGIHTTFLAQALPIQFNGDLAALTKALDRWQPALSGGRMQVRRPSSAWRTDKAQVAMASAGQERPARMARALLAAPPEVVKELLHYTQHLERLRDEGGPRQYAKLDKKAYQKLKDFVQGRDGQLTRLLQWLEPVRLPHESHSEAIAHLMADPIRWAEARSYAPQINADAVRELSGRTFEVLELWALGESMPQIRQAFGWSISAMENHSGMILKAFNAANLDDLATRFPRGRSGLARRIHNEKQWVLATEAGVPSIAIRREARSWQYAEGMLARLRKDDARLLALVAQGLPVDAVLAQTQYSRNTYNAAMTRIRHAFGVSYVSTVVKKYPGGAENLQRDLRALPGGQ